MVTMAVKFYTSYASGHFIVYKETDNSCHMTDGYSMHVENTAVHHYWLVLLAVNSVRNCYDLVVMRGIELSSLYTLVQHDNIVVSIQKN